MSDDRTPPAEPEPGSTEWLLAQLSGGRIDSRRERREAEAALEAAGVQLPDAATEPHPAAPATPAPVDAAAQPPSGEQPPAPEERPRARFSWETGTLEAVDSGGPAEPVTPRAAVPAPESAPAPELPRTVSELGAEAAPPAVPAAPASVTPFMWNLTPTAEPDPAVNPRAELPEPSSPQPDFFTPSAAPLFVPKPAAPKPAVQPPAPAADEPAVAEPELPEPALPELPELPEPAAAPAEPARLPAPLPPGTTAHEFDPFAQDLFAPPAGPNTPVPSVDEFTIPDEGAPAQASVPAPNRSAEPAEPTEPTQVTSDWSDIADMLGAHPETVDTAIVSPMPPVNEILPSFDAILPRAATPDRAQGQAPAAPVPPRRANAPVEHSRGGGSLNRWLLIAAAVLVAIIIGVALFTLGRSIAAGNDQAPVAATRTSTPSPTTSVSTPSPTPTMTTAADAAGTGPVTPGQSYQWDQLRGGECVNPFSSPWAQQFAVVDCGAQHAAQLVYTAPFSTDPAAAFPGEQAIASQITLLCSKPGVIDLNAASVYNDVQLVAAYPVNAEQWSAGQRNYYCFVTRASGQPFSSSIAGPGPTE